MTTAAESMDVVHASLDFVLITIPTLLLALVTWREAKRSEDREKRDFKIIRRLLNLLGRRRSKVKVYVGKHEEDNHGKA